MLDLVCIGVAAALVLVLMVHGTRARAVVLIRKRRPQEFPFRVGDKVIEWRAFTGHFPGVVMGIDPRSDRPVLVQFDRDHHHRRPGPARWCPIEGKDKWGQDNTSLRLQDFFCEACHDIHPPRFADCLLTRPMPERESPESFLH